MAEAGNTKGEPRRRARDDRRRAPDELAQVFDETGVKVAAAALTAAVSPPLGVAVAAGAALRSPRVRTALRRGTVQALAGAMRVGDQLTGAHAREEAGPAAPADDTANVRSPARRGSRPRQGGRRAGN